jgi:DNA-binding NarL/FixJ family response regulator
MIVLLLFKPGDLRDGLNALLYTIPDVQLVVHAHDASAALEFCRKNPNILIITEIKPGDRALLAQVPEMKALSPQMRVMALIHDENDREAAEKAGMDSILEVGMRAPVLKAAIEDVARNLPTIETNDSKRWLG